MRLLIFFLASCPFVSVWSQNQTDEQNTVLWREYLSYGSLQEVIHDGPIVYGASDQGVFVYSDLDGSIRRITKVNGLNDFDIVDIGLHRGFNALSIQFWRFFGTFFEDFPEIF